MATESEHFCVLDREYPAGIMACAGCGRFWMIAGSDIRRWAFIALALHRRLNRYQLDIEFGKHATLREAVQAAAARAREAEAAATAKIRADWPRIQASKRAKWWRCVRPIILSRPCAYCGDPATAVDHIIPLSRGGAHRMSNLAPACMWCNTEKGNRTPEEWKAWRLRLGRSWPPSPRTEAA